MTALLLAALATLPCVYWTQGIESRVALNAAGVKRICVAPDMVEAWRAAGFSVSPITPNDLTSRVALPVPGVTARAGLASPTRSPWVVANGWQFVRQPKAAFVYDLPAGKAALAAAEAFAYGADAVMKIDPADLGAAGAMLTFLEGVPASDLPALADLGIVDDGSPITGEVLNLLARRNLLFQIVQGPSAQFRVNIAIGSAAYPLADAADPSAFAQKVRRELSDDQRTLRVYGSEVVIGRLTGNDRQIRLHLLNYGGRDIEGLRIRIRGAYGKGDALVAGAGRLPLADFAVAGGATEFSVPRISTYAVIDLMAAK
jgi:hypothetical protein